MKKPGVILILMLSIIITGCGSGQDTVPSITETGEVQDQMDTANPVNTGGPSSGEKISMQYNTYANARFGYSLDYPDLYSASRESDNGDGVTLESDDGIYTLRIWGSYNVLNDSGKTLLADARERVTDIYEEYAEEKFYRIEYGGGVNEKPSFFYECGYITGDCLLGFIIQYPEEEQDEFNAIIARMTDNLKTNQL